MSQNKYAPMQIKVLNVEKYVKDNYLPRVNSIKKLSANKTMDEAGLFSEKIFGRIGSEDRMNKMAYIELNYKCLQPYICIALERMSADFVKTIQGNLWWIKDGNKLTKTDEDNGNTGLKFVYDNFELFISNVFKENGSKVRDQNLQLLKSHHKDELFTSKWLIIPAGFRDLNTLDIETKGKSDYDEINDYYTSIISISNQLGNMLELNSSLVDSKFGYQIQQNINNIYRLLVEKKLAKKGGLIQKSALAKTISYSSGNVICNAKMTRNHYKEDLSNNIPFGYIGIPTQQLTDMFYPFVVYRFKELFEFNKNNIYDIFKGILHTDPYYSMTDVINKIIDTFKTDSSFMLKRLEYDEYKYSIKIGGKETILKVIDFIKNEVIDPVIHDKFVTATRFPVDNKLSQQYLKPKSLSTDEVKRVIDDDGFEYELSTNDLIQLAYMPNLHSLKPFGGDFDQISTKQLIVPK